MSKHDQTFRETKMKEIKIQTLEEMSDDMLKILAEYAAYKLGCERALALLEDPDASGFDANKLEVYLNKILKGVTT